VKIRVDPQRCQGHTVCAMIAPNMFQLSEIDGSSSAVSEVVSADQEGLVREAVHSCPEQAIHVEEPQDGFTKVNLDPEKTMEMTA
jgi:ferredoxin